MDMVIRGYDYGIDISDDIEEIKSVCKARFEEETLESSEVDQIEYLGIMGTRIYMGVPGSFLYDKSISVLVVSVIGKYIYDKYGLTYGVEIIPLGQTDYLMHVFRELRDIEEVTITESLNKLEI